MTSFELSRLQYGSTGVLATGKWFGLRALAWAVVLFVFAAVAFVASLRLSDWLSLSAAYEYGIAIVVPLLSLVVYALAVRLCEQRRAHEVAWQRAPLQLLLGGLVGFAFMALSLLLLWMFGLNDVSRGHWQHAFHYFVFNAYVSGVMEELAFRAILLRIFARMFGPLSGLLISAVLFALAHAGHASPMAVALLGVNGGLLLGVLYMVSGNLWVPIGAHIAYDFTEWSLFGVDNTDGYLIVTPSAAHATWLTGGSTGPDGSVLSAIVAIALMALVVLVRRHGRYVVSAGVTPDADRAVG